MPSTSAKVMRIFSMEWSTMLQYRFDMTLWMLAEAAIPLISLALWYTVSVENEIGANPQEIVTYYILIMFIKIATDAWNGVFMAREILNGEIVKDLVKPVGVFWRHVANNMVEKLFKFLLPVPIFIFFLATFPRHFAPAIYEPRNQLWFGVSLLLAIGLGFIADMVIGSLAFWLEDVFQIRRYKIMLESIASGLLVPFAVMPELVRELLSFLPFRYILSAPAEILLGQTDPVFLVTIQCAWVVGLSVLTRFMWWRGLQRYAVPGQ